jgi:hypothetical protein
MNLKAAFELVTPYIWYLYMSMTLIVVRTSGMSSIARILGRAVFVTLCTTSAALTFPAGFAGGYAGAA